jgi:hypothetical protein
MLGSCLCGDVAFEIDRSPSPLGHCHCSICRKLHGTAFASFAAAPESTFRWLHGSEKIRRFESSAGVTRGFCPRCGSSAPDAFGSESVRVPLGLLDADPQIGALPQLFVGSRATRRVTEPKPGSLRGACQCGAVAYEIVAPLAGEIVRCHCSRCRKARAAAHASNVFVSLSDFRWLHGDDQVDSFKVPDALRFTQAFCRGCGSPLPRVDPQRGIGVVPAGSLEDEPGIREGRHIFVGSKAPWFEIGDSAPRYDEYPPA